MAVYVGLDPATISGWGVLNEHGDRLASGVWDCSNRPGDGAGMRLVRFNGSLRRLLEAFPEDPRVFYERGVYRDFNVLGPDGRPRKVANAASRDLAGELIGQILYICEVKRVPYARVDPMTVKKAAGSGRLKKEQMVIEANSRWPELGIQIRYPAPTAKNQLPAFPGGRDNEADALWVAEAGRMGIIG